MTSTLALMLVQASIAVGAPVTVRVADVRDGRGEVRVELCSSGRWLKSGCEFSIAVPAVKGETVVTVPNVPPGAWAVQAYHDRNANKEVDRGPLGIPAEEIGFSNRPPVGLRGPAFSRAAFDHADAEIVHVRLKRYWGP